MKKVVLTLALAAMPMAAIAEETEGSWMDSISSAWESAKEMISGSAEAGAEAASDETMAQAKEMATEAVDASELSEENKDQVKDLIDSNM